MKIEWIGPARDLPGMGAAEPGSLHDLPEDAARSYIGQGLAQAAKEEQAREPAQKRTRKTEEN
jgi:hypothetical protein